ncbi:MAG: hypothetical protein N3J91_13715, partial [Verrucomicrobiae bacterium]|nr:hypothetical protein [Verrucomicrobiae bacterium]
DVYKRQVLMRGNDDAAVGVGGWVDGRLNEYRMEMSRLAMLCYDVPHWMGEQLLGDAAAVQQINEVMTHLWYPDGTVMRVRVDEVQFS